MYKIISTLCLATVLAGCCSPADGDWVQGNGCQMYSSETPRDLANCQDYAKEAAAKEKLATVSLQKSGTKVGLDEGLKDDDNSTTGQ